MTGRAVKPRIMCVDDEPRVLEGLTLHLRSRYEVRIATGGDAGLQLLTTARRPVSSSSTG